MMQFSAVNYRRVTVVRAFGREFKGAPEVCWKRAAVSWERPMMWERVARNAAARVIRKVRRDVRRPA
jgi:hypothetical protein